jgi:hypothetical protein
MRGLTAAIRGPATVVVVTLGGAGTMQKRSS